MSELGLGLSIRSCAQRFEDKREVDGDRAEIVRRNQEVHVDAKPFVAHPEPTGVPSVELDWG